MKVSVAMITYNHEKFIAQAIDSVLMQQTDFDYELVIGEDCSTDRTRQIVVDYQEKHPNKIRTLLHPYNLGPLHSPGMNNFINTIKACKGQYIALLEGDDYWTDHLKLQKQVDILDNHPECAICFHNAMEVNERTKESHLFNKEKLRPIMKLEDLLDKNIIPTCSVLFRNKLFDKFPAWFHKLPFGDWPLHILNAEYGDIIYINEVMGIHRIHGGGVWSGDNGLASKDIERLLIHIKLYKIINEHLRYQHDKIIRTKISNRWYQLALLYREHDDFKNMKKCLLEGFISKPFNSFLSARFILTSFLSTFFPNAYRSYIRKKVNKN